MNWDEAISAVRPHVARIETPTGYGTGFLAFYNHDKTWCGIATAAHVVKHADDWQQPIKIINETSGPIFLKSDERVIYIDTSNDSAVILFVKSHLELPELPITLMPVDQPANIGIDIGWLGFPSIEPDTMCFFAGTISARQAARKSYLIDGVAINGVSGGPVFHCPTPETLQILGCVSAYHANRATGEALPGLLRAQDVSHFRGVAEQIRTSTRRTLKRRNLRKRKSDQNPPRKPHRLDWCERKPVILGHPRRAVASGCSDPQGIEKTCEMQPAKRSELKRIISPAVGFVMTSAQEHKLVAALSLLILAVYFPAASYLLRTYVPDQPPPPGAVRLFHNIEKISRDGIGFMELIRGYRPRADLRIYEDDRSLTRATGISEVDRLPGRFAEEGGVGIALSATDSSNVKSNR